MRNPWLSSSSDRFHLLWLEPVGTLLRGPFSLPTFVLALRREPFLLWVTVHDHFLISFPDRIEDSQKVCDHDHCISASWGAVGITDPVISCPILSLRKFCPAYLYRVSKNLLLDGIPKRTGPSQILIKCLIY